VDTGLGEHIEDGVLVGGVGVGFGRVGHGVVLPVWMSSAAVIAAL
jgi:hypothetical protein